jgi:hypothetical protein
MTTTTEHHISQATLRIADTQANGVATYKRLRAEIPKHIALSQEDWTPSETRNGEPMWHQLVRNIKSHSMIEGNYIREGWLEHVPRSGYRITPAGRRRLVKGKA